jgi:hypothetical protein
VGRAEGARTGHRPVTPILYRRVVDAGRDRSSGKRSSSLHNKDIIKQLAHRERCFHCYSPPSDFKNSHFSSWCVLSPFFEKKESSHPSLHDASLVTVTWSRGLLSYRRNGFNPLLPPFPRTLEPSKRHNDRPPPGSPQTSHGEGTSGRLPPLATEQDPARDDDRHQDVPGPLSLHRFRMSLLSPSRKRASSVHFQS